MEDIECVSKYVHLQTLELNGNKLTHLKALNTLKYIKILTASRNQLTTDGLNFEPPGNLQLIDFSYNSIERIAHIEQHRFLRHLCLDHNNIEVIEGLSGCKYLTHLSLRGNKIKVIEHLKSPILQYLNLSYNRISKIQSLSEDCPNLEILDLSFNEIKTTQGLGNLPLLTTLNLQGNLILKIENLWHIKELPLLYNLNVLGNALLQQQALKEDKPLRLNIAINFPRLTILNDERLSAEEKITSINRFSPPQYVIDAVENSRKVRDRIRNNPVTSSIQVI